MENKDNKELNLVEVLKDCPEGTELYTPMFGKVRLVKVDVRNCGMPICVKLQNHGERFLTSDGRYDIEADGECVLFPSKENRDWSTFKVPEPSMPSMPSKEEYVFEPFDKVMVRDCGGTWSAGLFSHKKRLSSKRKVIYFANGTYWDECVPYEGNEHLLGTCDDAD